MDDVKIRVAKNIKMFRESKGMTQKELAELLDVGYSVICNWEMGTNSPNIVKLFMMCRIFDITPSAIFGMTDSDIQAAYDQAEPKIRKAVNSLLEQPEQETAPETTERESGT